jgi:VanZ family protein
MCPLAWRWLWALLLTVAVGACWELAQTTIVGRTARLSDLLPDAVGAALGCLLGAGLLRWTDRVDRRRPR